jgi:hypothetical protein
MCIYSKVAVRVAQRAKRFCKRNEDIMIGVDGKGKVVPVF